MTGPGNDERRPARGGDSVEQADSHQDRTAVDQPLPVLVDPAMALMGALLHCTAPSALRVLDLVADDDLADHRHQQILRVIRELVAAGRAPDPATVHARLRADGTATGADAAREYMELLIDAHAGCATPASAPWYAAAVLEEALRRRGVELGTRVAQAAQGDALDVLIEVLDRECRAVRALMHRRDAAAGEAPARLRAVS